MFSTWLAGPWTFVVCRLFLTNALVLTAAAAALAVTPATVSFPIAFAEALVFAAGLGVTLALNLVVLVRACESRHAWTPFRAGSASDAPRATEAGGDVAAPPADAPRATVATSLAAPDDARARRLVVCWKALQHLSDGEAEQWASTKLQHALRAEGIGCARLIRLAGASRRYGKPYDWLLEFEAAPGRDGHGYLDAPAWREWLVDLRLLGLRPVALVAERDRVLAALER